jgi:high affinity sulfate transporter 1
MCMHDGICNWLHDLHVALMVVHPFVV